MFARGALRKIAKIRFFIGFFIIGAIFLTISIFAFKVPKVERELVIGEIVNIEEYLDFSNDISYKVYVKYIDNDGVLHENVVYPSYNFLMKVGKEVKIYYNINDKEDISSLEFDIFPIVFLSIGGLMVLFVAIMLVKALVSGDVNEFDLVQMENATDDVIEEIKNNNEETNEYYFHYFKKASQSYILETKDRESIYEAVCEHNRLFKPSVYKFIDRTTGLKKTKKISHTKTSSYSINKNGSSSFYVPTSSYFKIDDINIWEYIGKLGYSIEPKIENLGIDFDIYHYGVKVASLISGGINLMSDDKQYKLGNIKTPGIYRVFCKESDIEAVFMIAFTVSRVEFV